MTIMITHFFHLYGEEDVEMVASRDFCISRVAFLSCSVIHDVV